MCQVQASTSRGEQGSPPQPKPSLVEGRYMRCPNCEELRDPMNERQLKRLERPVKYKDELNVIFLCRRETGGCGHVFSPTDREFTEVIKAWLSGDLVPKHHVNTNGNKEVEVVNR